MRYTVRTDTTARKVYCFADGEKCPYITPEEYDRLRQEHKTGRIGADARKTDSEGAERILCLENREWGLYGYQAKKKWNEKIKGYIPVTSEDGEELYIRIIERSVMKGLLYPLVFLLFFVGIIIGTVWFVNRDKIPGLEETAIAYNPKGLENTNPNEIMLPGLGKIQGGENDTHIQQILLNPKGNPCYFIFRLKRKDTEELLYESGLVEPGKAIMEFDMAHPLKQGVYDAVLEIETRDLEDYEAKLNGGTVNIKLEILKKE